VAPLPGNTMFTGPTIGGFIAAVAYAVSKDDFAQKVTSFLTEYNVAVRTVEGVRWWVPSYPLSGSYSFNRQTLSSGANSRTRKDMPRWKRAMGLRGVGERHPRARDATSPSRRGFQEYNEGFLYSGALKHVLKENFYPSVGTRERAELEGATRWTYDIFSGKAERPAQFFDPKSAVCCCRRAISIRTKSAPGFAKGPY